MVSKAAKTGIVAAAIGAGVVGGVLLLTKGAKASPTPVPTTPVPTTLTISAQTTTPAIDTNDTITTVLTDQNGNPLSGYTVTLLEDTTSTEGTATTDSTGTATFSVYFPNAGTYYLVAEVTY